MILLSSTLSSTSRPFLLVCALGSALRPPSSPLQLNTGQEQSEKVWPNAEGSPVCVGKQLAF